MYEFTREMWMSAGLSDSAKDQKRASLTLDVELRLAPNSASP